MDKDIKIQSYIQEFIDTPQGSCHTALLTLANRLVLSDSMYRDRQTLENALLDAGRRKWGSLDADFYTDVEKTADKAIQTAGDSTGSGESTGNNGTVHHPKTGKEACLVGKDYQRAREAWREAMQGAGPAIASEIEQSDKAEKKRVSSPYAMRSVFKNAGQGFVWFADADTANDDKRKNLSEKERAAQNNKPKTWAAVADIQNRRVTFHREILFCPCVFGDELHVFENKDTGEKWTIPGVYKRWDRNVKEIVAILMELDAPLKQSEHIDYESADTESRKAYRDRIFQDTCLILDNLKVRPTTVTFSGSKSYHCLFRLAKPITPAQFKAELPTLQSAYKIIGLDAATLTISRACRFPRGCRQGEAEQGDCQRVMFLDDNADIEFSALVEAFSRLATEIEQSDTETGAEMAMQGDGPAIATDDASEDDSKGTGSADEAEAEKKAVMPVYWHKSKQGNWSIMERLNDTAFQEAVGIYRIRTKGGRVGTYT